MSKVLLFSHDFGGANTIIPLVKKLRKRNCNVLLYGKNYSLKKYLAFGLDSKNIDDEINSEIYTDVLNFVKKEKPDLIITGTSAEDFTEKYLWIAANSLKIPTCAILDQWMNYGVRFSKYPVSLIEEYEKEKKHDYMPSKIAVMDDYAKKEAILEGLDEDKIIITGQPYFDLLLDWKKSITKINFNSLKSKLGINQSDFVITYISDYISSIYGNMFGYTDLTVFQELINALDIVARDKNIKISLIIKRHPTEENDLYTPLIKNFNNKNIKFILVDNLYNPFDLIGMSDLLCGISSIMLIESLIIGKPIISIQIGLKRKSFFPLDSRGLVKSIMDSQDLIQKIISIIENKENRCEFNILSDAASNLINKLEVLYGKIGS
ncbi:CDP-glycerol glycerophosphotransferase family protein [Candidatus Babeliales bacterium]|nr:CDP-glycerol glycerophosphotransferase family protein [Candidatus Babeliales bacterium]